MKLLKDFDAVPDGEIYPRTLKAGEDCPPELVPHAAALGYLDPAEVEAAAAREATADDAGAEQTGDTPPATDEGGKKAADAKK